MLAEYSNYHDFDGCMLAGGWERVKHVPYAVSELAHENHLRAHIDYRHRERFGKPSRGNGDFADLND